MIWTHCPKLFFIVLGKAKTIHWTVLYMHGWGGEWNYLLYLPPLSPFNPLSYLHPSFSHSLSLPPSSIGWYFLEVIATWQKRCDSSSQLKLPHTHTTPGRGREQEIRKSGGRPPLVVVCITLLRLGRGNCAIATHTCSDSVQWFAVGWGACLVTAGDGRKYAQKAFHYITALDW